MKIFHLYFLATFAAPFHCFSQSETAEKCFAQSLMPNVYKVLGVEEFAIYTGNESEEDVETEEIEVEVLAKGSIWTKKGSDRKCLSADSNDCFIWCLEEVSREVIKLKILHDTTASKKFQIRKVLKRQLIQKGGFKKEVEVLCPDKISADWVSDLQLKLKEKGFFKQQATAVFDASTQAALTAFQKENDLPQGNLDFQTLEILGLDFD